MTAGSGDWWERFFSGRNRLTWDDGHRRGQDLGGWAQDVLPWIELLRDPNPDLPVVLPCLDQDMVPQWYCGGRSRRGALRLREELFAFVGPSFANFDGRPYRLDQYDSVEAAFGEGTIAPVYRFGALQPSDVEKIRRALGLYMGVLRRAPRNEERRQRPLGILRAEFDRALLAADEAEARRLLQHIRSLGRLEVENLLFLEVRLLAGLGNWRQITDDSRLLASLSNLRLPPRVLADVIESLYRVHVEPTEDTAQPEEALHAFRAAAMEQHSALFGTRRGLTQPSILKAFFLYEMCRARIDNRRLESLQKALSQVSDDGFAVALAGLVPAPPPALPSDAMAEAEAAFDVFDFDVALELYLDAEPTRKRLARLIQCSEQIGTKEVAARVLDRIERDHGSELGNLPASIAEKLETLREQAALQTDAGDPSDGWLEWARWVDSGASTDDALSLLREHSVTWKTKTLEQDPASVDELAATIGNAHDAAADVFREAYPQLFQGFVPDSGPPVRGFKPLLKVLLANSVLLDGPSPDELELVREIATALLAIGLGKDEYDDLVADLEDLFGYQASLSTLSWLLDITEVLVIHACPDPEKRLRFAVKVLDFGRRVSHRLTRAHRIVLDELCMDLQLECPADFSEELEEAGIEEAVCAALDGRRIAIYTLTENAGQRAAATLTKMFPGVSVDLNDDHVCTETLKRLARNAHIFVFAWRSSKHQAYYCVKDHRPEGLPLLQPLGKGSSSIVREIVENTVH